MKIVLKTIILLIGFSLLAGCSSVVRFSSEPRMNSAKITTGNSAQTDLSQFPGRMTGKASYYGNEFESRMTSSGEVYSGSKLTAAHRELPFGTYLLVTNRKNQKKVTVKVNDRGPFVYGRILDLSHSAAEALGMIKDGVADVEIEIIGQE